MKLTRFEVFSTRPGSTGTVIGYVRAYTIDEAFAIAERTYRNVPLAVIGPGARMAA